MKTIGIGQLGNFHWWEGVVEDNLDPRGAGRCKVRVMAHNSPFKAILSTEDLPWAYPLMPLNNPHGKIVALKPGTRVTGYYRDGSDGQDLVMMGTINTGYENPGSFEDFEDSGKIKLGSAVERTNEDGFIDDRKGAREEPIEGQPQKTQVIPDEGVEGGLFLEKNITDYGPIEDNEINTPRLTRGITEGTISQAQMESMSSVTSVSGDAIPEPESQYAAQYPFNAVEESDSGHFREIDDTPGAERIKESHRTGTFYEIHPDGTKVTKVVKDEFSVTIGDKGVKVEGICAVHVVGKSDFYCESDVNIKTDANAKIEAVDVTINASGGADITTGDDCKITTGSNAEIKADKNSQVIAKGKIFVAGSEVDISATGFVTIADSTGTASDVFSMIIDRT